MKLFFYLFLIIPISAKADLMTTLVIGSMFVGDSKEVVKTDFEVQIEKIEKKCHILMAIL